MGRIMREEAIEALRYRRNIINNVDIDWCANEIDAIDVALSTLRPVSRERIEEVWSGCHECSGCKLCIWNETKKCNDCKNRNSFRPLSDFCPRCGKPLTDAALEMVMERLEKIK